MDSEMIIIAIQIIIILVITLRNNPHEKGSRPWETVRVCKAGMALAILSFGFGLLGFALAAIAFILGIMGTIRGQTFFGIRVMAAAVIIPALSIAWTLS